MLGRRRVFLAGLGVFTLASLASGLAHSGGVLIPARAGQGVGAALLSPSALAIVTTTFRGAERNRALGSGRRSPAPARSSTGWSMRVARDGAPPPPWSRSSPAWPWRLPSSPSSGPPASRWSLSAC